MEVSEGAFPSQADKRLHRIIEGLTFAAGDIVSPAQIADVIAEVTGGDPPSEEEILSAVDELNESFAANNRGVRIQKWAGGLQMTTGREVAPYLKTFREQTHERRLSRSLMETLAIVAYRQPTTKPEVDYVRGVDADYALRKLMGMDLVDVVGRSDSVGRPMLYGTTDDFLTAFGLNSLDDLPDLREVEELLDDPAFDKERAELLMLRELPVSPSVNGNEEASGTEAAHGSNGAVTNNSGQE